MLTDFYRTVTVVERDVLPDGPANRRGVPQGRHVHALLGRGSQVLSELFPGFLDELVAAGAPVLDYSDLSKGFFCATGHQFLCTGGFTNIPPSFLPSRPLLESLVRRRVRETANVTLLEGYDLVDLTSTPTRGRITGAHVHGESDQVLTANLVVDATGRGSRTPVFLATLGTGARAKTKWACVWFIPVSYCGSRRACSRN